MKRLQTDFITKKKKNQKKKKKTLNVTISFHPLCGWYIWLSFEYFDIRRSQIKLKSLGTFIMTIKIE